MKFCAKILLLVLTMSSSISCVRCEDTTTSSQKKKRGLRTTENDKNSLSQDRGLSEFKFNNIDMITNGFNALTGEPANQQRKDLRHGKLWNLTPSSGGTFPYTELSDRSTVSSCSTSIQSNSVSYIRSSSSLQSQSSYNEVDVGVKIPVGPAEVSAATTIKNSLMVGNSETSKRAFDQGRSKYDQSSYSRATRVSYSVGVDYDSVISWTDEFKYACSELGSQPSTSQVLDFFKKFGTHGILKATFGKECSSSTYLGSEQTLTSYNEFMSSRKTVGVEIFGLGFEGGEEQENLTEGSEEITINVQFSSEECAGELEREADCQDGKTMNGNGADSPIIVDSQYVPIWLMNVPTLSQGAKNKLENVFQDFIIAAVNCADNNCNSHGACAPNLGAWYASTSSSNDALDTFFDGSKCFCFDDFRDDGNERCAKGQAISVLTPSEFTPFINEWDGKLEYMPDKRQPLCGIHSIHNNDTEDRKFKLRECNIDREWEGEQTTYRNRWDDEFLFQCDIDKVITGLLSLHDNYFEDRRWNVRCTHFKNTIVDENSCEGIDIPRNEYDLLLDYTCPLGKVLHKFGGVHNNYFEDRRFRFACCELIYYEDDDSLSTSDWSPYENDYDGPLEVTAKHNGMNGAFSGISSIHHSHFEDRLFRFQVSVPPGNSKKLEGSIKKHKNDWDGTQEAECPKDYVFTYIRSEHWNEKEDRWFEFECEKFDGMETNHCHTTKLVNDWEEEFEFSCGSQHVLTGMWSSHHDGFEDRVFQFKCCRWTKAREVEKLSLVG